MECVQHAPDCQINPVDTCASYDGGYASVEGSAVLLVFGALVAAVMCFCIGGNDSANSWGSVVGVSSLSLACLPASPSEPGGVTADG